MTTHRLRALELSLLMCVESGQCWSAKDSADALAHQLKAPLAPDLAAILATSDTSVVYHLHEMAEGHTFHSVLTAPCASLQLLRYVKAFGRVVRDFSECPLAGGPGTVLYYAAIAAALLQGGRISSLGSTELREGFIWSGEQKGAESLSDLFLAALKALRASRYCSEN